MYVRHFKRLPRSFIKERIYSVHVLRSRVVLGRLSSSVLEGTPSSRKRENWLTRLHYKSYRSGGEGISYVKFPQTFVIYSPGIVSR